MRKSNWITSPKIFETTKHESGCAELDEYGTDEHVKHRTFLSFLPQISQSSQAAVCEDYIHSFYLFLQFQDDLLIYIHIYIYYLQFLDELSKHVQNEFPKVVNLERAKSKQKQPLPLVASNQTSLRLDLS